jgi:hypothetical protein
MKILMINKFLHPNGGSETYMFTLGKFLQQQGHSVEYFGMEHAGRCVGNTVNSYTSDMNFHKTNGLKKNKLRNKNNLFKRSKKKNKKSFRFF